MKKLLKREEGFTLIELMVVVLIIGILVAIAIPVFNSTQVNARKRACFANERTIEGSVQQYNAEANEFGGSITAGAAGWAAELVKSYATTDASGQSVTYGPWLAKVPICPGAGTYTFSPTIAGVVKTNEVWCSVHNHF